MVLRACSNPEYEANGICSWSAKGDSIIIHNLRDFSDTVLPKYFKHGNFQSFVRQLNMYNFRKTVADPTNGEFRHPLFQRGMRHLLHQIRRKVGVLCCVCKARQAALLLCALRSLAKDTRATAEHSCRRCIICYRMQGFAPAATSLASLLLWC